MPDPSEPPVADLSDADLAGAVVCYAQCYACMFDSHYDPPKVHTWMDDDDAEHAGHTLPLAPEVIAAKPCACPCAKPKETTRAH